MMHNGCSVAVNVKSDLILPQLEEQHIECHWIQTPWSSLYVHFEHWLAVTFFTVFGQRIG